MRTSYIALAVGLFLAAAVAADLYFQPATMVPVPPSGPLSLNCDRLCLEAVVDLYLEALVANDPSELPVSKDVRFTENNQPLDLGDGFWKTATSRGRYAHYLSDPVTGQAAFFGTVEEGDHPVLLALRLRLELGRITEIETETYRPVDYEDPAELEMIEALQAAWLGEIPQPDRLSRQEMIAVANAWFEAYGGGFAAYDPFTDDCTAIENGISGLPCQGPFEGGDARQVTRVHDRRFPLVDEERGVVWASAILDKDGTVPGGSSRPSSEEVSAALLVRSHLIEHMEIISAPAPYHSSSPWGGIGGD